MRNGDVLCMTCGEAKADQVLKWFSVDKPSEPAEGFPCSICDFTAKSESGLASHMRAHERATKEATEETPEELDDAEVVAEEPEEAEG